MYKVPVQGEGGGAAGFTVESPCKTMIVVKDWSLPQVK